MVSDEQTNPKQDDPKAPCRISKAVAYLARQDVCQGAI